MRIVSDKEIRDLNITPGECVDWVRESFLMKYRSQLPPKISLHPQGTDFINTMPCLLPPEYEMFGCKVVSRIKGTTPALKSDMMLIDTKSGNMVALMNADWITAMRTGAVAALAISRLRNSKSRIYSFIGLGVIGHATLDCLLSTFCEEGMTIRFKKYKDHAEKAVEEYSAKYPHVRFEICDTNEELVEGSDVVVSCITEADGLIVKDTNLYKPGVLVVPVHTRGFQNCDAVFDRVIADDEGHVKGFKYFSEFKNFAELSQVLNGTDPGRENDQQRILSYNIGLGLHDVVFGNKILKIIEKSAHSNKMYLYKGLHEYSKWGG